MRMLRVIPVLSVLVLLALCLMPCRAVALDVTVKVSSVKVDFGLPYAPENLLDGDPSTAWVGGGIGAGVGQWVDLSFVIPTRVTRIGIFNGHQGEGKFDEFRRIRSGRVVYPDGFETRFWLRDEPGEQVIRLPGRPAKSLRIVVESVFPEGNVTSRMKLAVSEIKLYLALMADPGDSGDRKDVGSQVTPAKPPVDPDKAVPEPLAELLRVFYVRHTTLADDYAELFAEDVRDRNDFRFEVFKEVQRQRGTYNILRTAKVDPSGLGFEMVERDGAFAKVRVFGAYRVQVADIDTNLEEDSVFVLTLGADGWKIVELEGEEEIF
ncbi:hypothetical protein GM415_00200 [Pseudodesulfovibrio cashew]|uniref:NAD glycohydrolase translocation F5/8 type C domain-containing protein n=1 Tax=Pseudodesulfovibrio cashew TaxID=2678688 RepID=A0A6I6JF59_9BACT|nr:hypothetical protein [Pseudodesulfovibrio cashew]QGY38627.1 hypothetical protein GM415_00200 [Pseudodesulfovibrio cashew]